MSNIAIRSDLLEDLSALTTIQKASLERLCTQIYKCICYDINEAKLDNDNTVIINVGIGNLTIYFTGSEIKYRFTPSMKLEECLIDTIKNNKQPIIEEIEESLIKKIQQTYKELF